uniref:Small ribosomal subunit protein uS3m n=1 Tax=[Candida] vartiovaarae TaxID=51918 RepID=S5U5J4_9ASCO|nr:ribosomal protein S3 [[Candida] vartiovaarae]AGS44381.1 ribosomal protein S3 [[Candida] vartiovaarae]
MRNQKQSYLYKLSAQGANKLLSNLNVLYLNQYLSEYNNKGTKLQNSNMMNSWNNQLYKFNKNEVINTVLLDKLVSKLLIKLFVIKEMGINNINRRIFINKPKFKHTINTVFINFNYNDTAPGARINNKHTLYYGSLIKDINNILGCLNNNNNNNNNSLLNISTYLSELYNKKVIIIPNKVKYNYNDNIIFNSSISYDLDKYKGGLAGKTYSKLLRDNIPMNNSLSIKNNYITNIINNNNIKYNNIISNNNNTLRIDQIYKSFDINKITNELLVNKYLIGLSILFKGKNIKKAGVSRSIKEKLLFGSLSNKLYKKNSGLLVSKNTGPGACYLNFDININKKYKLNYIPNHHAISQLSKVNKAKTGVYGISVKLNTI